MHDYNHVLPAAASSQNLYIYQQLIAYTCIETVTRLSGTGYLFLCEHALNWYTHVYISKTIRKSKSLKYWLVSL